MLTALDYITINGTQIYKPPEFSPTHEDVYKAEIETMDGSKIADRIGWKFADMDLEWGALPQSMVDVLVGMNGQCTIAFDDLDGTQVEEACVRASVVGLRNRNTIDGVTVWKNVTCRITFLNTHVD